MGEVSYDSIIQRYMPQVEKWARRFVRKKSGECVDDYDDYIQCAFLALTKFVHKHKEITPRNMGTLYLSVKREMFEQAHQMLALNVPFNQFKEKYLDIEGSVKSLEEMINAIGDTFASDVERVAGARWGFSSDVSAEERIDIRTVIKHLPEHLKRIYRLFYNGCTLQDIAEITGRPYTSVYDDFSRIRAELRKNAHPDFLTNGGGNKTERTVAGIEENEEEIVGA